MTNGTRTEQEPPNQIRMERNAMIAQVHEHFTSNPKVKELHVTADAQCFHTEHDAKNHERHLGANNKGVELMTREAVEKHMREQAEAKQPAKTKGKDEVKADPKQFVPQPLGYEGMPDAVAIKDEKGEPQQVAMSVMVEDALGVSTLPVLDWNALEDGERKEAIEARIAFHQARADEAGAKGDKGNKAKGK